MDGQETVVAAELAGRLEWVPLLLFKASPHRGEKAFWMSLTARL